MKINKKKLYFKFISYFAMLFILMKFYATVIEAQCQQQQNKIVEIFMMKNKTSMNKIK